METIIEAKNMTLQYDIKENPIIHNLNLSIGVNEFIVLTGSSGSGKTTILKSLYGALKIQQGHLTVCGIDMKCPTNNVLMHLRRNIGIIFQDYRLVDEWNIEENIMLPLKIKGLPHATCLQQVHKLLVHVKLLHKCKHFPHELSGGEQQRVAIARAIAHNPLLILADEPTGNLDSYSSEVIWNLLKAVNRHLGTAIVIATHHVAVFKDSHYKHYLLHNGTCNVTSL